MGEYHDFARRFTLACNVRYPGLKQTELARKLSVSNVTVSNWMNGHKLPSSKRMSFIAQRLGVSYDWLATGRGMMVSVAEDDIIDISDLPPDFKRAVRDLVHTYRGSPK